MKNEVAKRAVSNQSYERTSEQGSGKKNLAGNGVGLQRKLFVDDIEESKNGSESGDGMFALICNDL